MTDRMEFYERERLLAKQLDADLPEQIEVTLDIVLPMIEQAEPDLVVMIAADELAAWVRDLRRARVRDIERRAERERAEQARREAEERRRAEKERLAAMSEDERFEAKFKHGSYNQKNGGAYYWCQCPDCAKVREMEERFERETLEKIRQVNRQFAADLRMEWEQELLDAGFALPDGRMVAWGDATVEEHEQRANMLSKNAAANVEAAARHVRAITDIRAAGVTTLREVVERR